MKRFLNKLFEAITWQCAILLIVVTVDEMITGSATQKFMSTLVVDTIGYITNGRQSRKPLNSFGG